MIKDKLKQLFPYFALEFSKKLKPEKYGKVESFEEWQALIDKSPEDVEAIIKKAETLTDEDWLKIEEEYNKLASSQDTENIYNNNTDTMNTYEDEDIDFVKKGAKLKKLQSMKKGKKIGAKKCSCGCDMISAKAKGGKLIYKCSCGCGAKK